MWTLMFVLSGVIIDQQLLLSIIKVSIYIYNVEFFNYSYFFYLLIALDYLPRIL